jgi:hypothetical protein
MSLRSATAAAVSIITPQLTDAFAFTGSAPPRPSPAELRLPSGGYRTADTARSTSLAFSIIGTITPWTPASSDFMIDEGSFHGTRT